MVSNFDVDFKYRYYIMGQLLTLMVFGDMVAATADGNKQQHSRDDHLDRAQQGTVHHVLSTAQLKTMMMMTTWNLT